jgi:hypothetical protein
LSRAQPRIEHCRCLKSVLARARARACARARVCACVHVCMRAHVHSCSCPYVSGQTCMPLSDQHITPQPHHNHTHTHKVWATHRQHCVCNNIDRLALGCRFTASIAFCRDVLDPWRLSHHKPFSPATHSLAGTAKAVQCHSIQTLAHVPTGDPMMLSDGESPWTVTCVQVTDERALCCDCRHTPRCPGAAPATRPKDRVHSFVQRCSNNKKSLSIAQAQCTPAADRRCWWAHRPIRCECVQSISLRNGVSPTKLKGLAHTHCAAAPMLPPIHAVWPPTGPRQVQTCNLQIVANPDCFETLRRLRRTRC